MATVIKHSASEPADRPAIFNLGDIAIEARAIIARAQKQAEQILAAARAEADAIREQARQTGREQGYPEGVQQGEAAGRQEAQKKFDQQLARTGRALAEAVEQFNARKGRLLAEARQDLVALAVAAAEKIVRTRLQADADAAVRTLEAVIDLAGRASRLSIQVCPDDLETVRQFAPQLAARLTEQAEVQVSADPTMQSGGCRIVAWRETGQASEIDATIETQLQRLSAELLGQELDPE